MPAHPLLRPIGRGAARAAVLLALLAAPAAARAGGTVAALAPEDSVARDSIPVPPPAEGAGRDSIPVPSPADSTQLGSPAAAPAAADTAARDTSGSAVTPAPAESTAARATAAPDTSARWALVLSGGVARGFAQVGALRALEEEGLRPDLVVGSSMGGLVGALYASGYSSRDIQDVARTSDWSGIFGPRTEAYAWRGPARPQPWLRFVGVHRGLRFPSALLDDSELNYALVKLFLDADVACGGDFDRLPIRFRTVATDLATARWVELSHGSVARAVRATAGLPMVFAPISDGQHLLVDGGMSANMPLDLARHAGGGRLLAVDVSVPSPQLDENTSGLVIALQLFDLLNKRGQQDTLTSRDTFVWLKLPGISATDFAGVDTIIERGYREAKGPIHAFARASGLPRVTTPVQRPAPVLPRLARRIEWRGGPIARERTARAVLGSLPTGAFRPPDLLPALDRLRRSGLFESQWPSLDARGDSTVLALDVREKPARELGLAAAIGTDEGSRLWAGLALRPVAGPLPALVRLDGALRRHGWSLDLSAEPYALDRGNTGWFVRATHRFTDTRIFDRGERVGLLGNDRSEAMLGAQVSLLGRQLVQAGAGWGRVTGSGTDWGGPMAAVRTEAQGASHRLVEGEWAFGSGGYGRLNAWFDVTIKLGAFVVRPGVRAAAVYGEAPLDVSPALGGPPTLAGLHYDEWIGRRMGAGELRLAREFSSVFSLYVAGQLGVVDEPVSGADLGSGSLSAIGLGGEISTPVGPLRLEWGHMDQGRERLDLSLGERF